ncbi:hypothetical protein F4777DRAFT_525727 [Nemania sp. FL0916]|nr:hypothetical protein F4777DRAFT_525727 [Nemania sp. FL0916]
MAGHNFSRYMSSLWSVLFAPCELLFRAWRFFANAIDTTPRASLPSPRLPPSTTHTSTLASHSPLSASASASAFQPNAAAQAETETLATANPSSSSSASSLSSPDLHCRGPDPSSPIVSQEPRDHAASHGVATEDSDTHLANTVDSLSQEEQQCHQLVDMARKRANRRRGGAIGSQANQHMPATPATPVTPVTPITPAVPKVPTTESLTADTSRDCSPRPSQSDASGLGNTGLATNHANGPRPTSSKRGGNQTSNRNSTKPQQQRVDSKKENIAPSNDKDTSLRATLSERPEPSPLAAVGNAKEPQKPGTRSYSALVSTGTASVASTTHGEGRTSSAEAEELHAVADRLTLDDAQPPQQSRQQTLDQATAAAEASALPVPFVVAVPVLPQLRVPQPEQQTPPTPTLPGLIEPTTAEGRAERDYHLTFMREALDMGDLALRTNETPVGCVLVYRGRVIARGMNATNVTRNGTRHAEFMALSALLSRRRPEDVPVANNDPTLDDANWGDVDPKDGHIYPYGQKLHPAPVVDRSIISECVLYVTVEPCVMCASLLRQLGIKKVYFGAVNDKFGGTGGVFRVHMNSKPVPIPADRPYQLGYGPQDVSLISKGRAIAVPREDDDGDGGNVEAGYPVEGGYLRDDAVSLLRRFYVQENGRAPQPRKKEGRAARLYAALEGQAKTTSSDLSDNAPETPVDVESPMILGVKTEPVVSVVYA